MNIFLFSVLECSCDCEDRFSLEGIFYGLLDGGLLYMVVYVIDGGLIVFLVCDFCDVEVFGIDLWSGARLCLLVGS